VTAPREFSDWVRSAEFHCLQLEKSLSLAADKAPSAEIGQYTERQVGELSQLRRVLPSLRAHARRA
jgi:hypothetical protein